MKMIRAFRFDIPIEDRENFRGAISGIERYCDEHNIDFVELEYEEEEGTWNDRRV